MNNAFTFELDYVKKLVLSNRSIISWNVLYQYLGIEGILKSINKYDVGNIFCPNKDIQDIHELMKDNLKKARKKDFPEELKSLFLYKPEYRLKQMQFLWFNFAPTVDDNHDKLYFIW